MEKRHKAYKFRLYPTALQTELLAKTFGCVRFVYNHYLAQKKEVYEKEQKSLSYTQCAANLVTLKREHTFLKEVDSIALQQSLRHLDTAYQNFFRDKKVGYPRFKSKKKHRHSYSTVCVNQNIRLLDRMLVLPKVGSVRIKKHRMIPENYVLKSVTVSQEPSGKYFASILFAYETNIEPVVSDTSIGLDYSMKDLFVSSEEEIYADEAFLHHYRKMEKRLKKKQQTLSRRQKGSKRYKKQRLAVARLHEKVANQRKDYLHKLSRQIANAYDTVYVEDLNMQDMGKALHFGKSIADNGWGMFLQFLTYKLEEEGKRLVKVDKWYASSKTCSVCGHKYGELTLSMRIWECPVCHTIHDRDKNAAFNIKQEGMRMQVA